MGDLAYSHGRAAEFTNCYDLTWGRFSDRTRSAPGNHEYKTAKGYFGYWNQHARPEGRRPPPRCRPKEAAAMAK